MITFIYFTMIARYAGVHATGLFYLVLSYVSLFGAVIEFGLSNVQIRESSIDPSTVGENFRSTLIIKLVLSTIASLIGALLISKLEYPQITRNLVYWAIAITAIESIKSSFFGCFRAVHEMRYEALGLIYGQLLAITVGGISIYFMLSIYYLIGAVLLDSLFNLCFAVIMVYKKFPKTLWSGWKINYEKVFHYLKQAWPFALSALFAKAYAFDSVFLAKFMDERVVALYSIPSKLVTSLQFIPIALSIAIFPALSAYYAKNRARTPGTFLKSQDYLLWVVLPLVVVLTVYAEQIVKTVFGVNYGESAVPLQIMSIALIPMFLYQPMGSLLNAYGLQARNTSIIALSLTLHITTSLILIPRIGVTGAAISSLSSSSVLFILGLFFSLKVLDMNLYRYSYNLLQAVIPAAIMLAGILIVYNHINFIISTIIGAIIYLIATYYMERLRKNQLGDLSHERGKANFIFSSLMVGFRNILPF